MPAQFTDIDGISEKLDLTFCSNSSTDDEDDTSALKL
jgi:hypothetical protein